MEGLSFDETERNQLIPQCEADLPSGIRFGRVDVSCEGWNGPGDSNILHGKLKC